MIKNYLQWAQNTPKYQSSTTFKPKGTSILATDLLKSYFGKGLFSEARDLFDEMPGRDVVVWTAMISGYTYCNEYTQAWIVFVDMVKDNNVPPNAFTISSVLKACKGMNSVFFWGVGSWIGYKKKVCGGVYLCR